MDIVRFRQFGHLSNCEGMLHFDCDQLRLEYQIVDGILGVLRSGVKHVSISLADLASIEMAGGWLRSHRIVLQARRMEAVRDVPGMSQGRVELLVARSDREVARRLVGGLRKPDITDATGLDI